MRKKDSHDLRRHLEIIKPNTGRANQCRIAMMVPLVYVRAGVEQHGHGLGLNCYGGDHQRRPASFVRSIHVVSPLQCLPEFIGYPTRPIGGSDTLHSPERCLRCLRLNFGLDTPTARYLHQLSHSWFDASFDVAPDVLLMLQIFASA